MARAMIQSIVVRTQFEGLHHWPEAPDEVAFLRHPHRHQFHVRLEMNVQHAERELEFILVRRALDEYLASMAEAARLNMPQRYSCETVAAHVIEWATGKYGARHIECSVDEDGENGARVRTVDP